MYRGEKQLKKQFVFCCPSGAINVVPSNHKTIQHDL